ncbi:hypothetical protein PCE1_004256 [Barthelona sp. PCE]
MPRVVTRHFDRFSQICFGAVSIIVSSSPELNNYNFYVINESEERLSIPPCGLEPASKSNSRLFEAIIASGLFYRRLVTTLGDQWNIELELVQVKRYNECEMIGRYSFKGPRLVLQNGHLLNDEYWVYLFEGFISFINLRTGELSETFFSDRVAFFRFFSHNDILFIVSVADQKIWHNVAFGEDGKPFLNANHPLFKETYFCLDETPGQSCFIMWDKGPVTISISGNDVINVPIDYEIPKQRKSNEFIRFQDFILFRRNHTYVASREDIDLISELFLPFSVDGILYNYKPPSTEFNKVLSTQGKGFVCLKNDELIPELNFNVDVRKISYSKVVGTRYVLDLFNNRSFFFQPAQHVFEGEVSLMSTGRIYDSDSAKWKMKCLTSSNQEYNLYIDNVLVSSIVRPSHQPNMNFPKFSDRITVLPCVVGDRYLLMVDDKMIATLRRSGSFEVVGNTVWIVEHRQLTMIKIDDDFVPIKHYLAFDEERLKIKMINEYDSNELLVSGNSVDSGNVQFFVKFNGETNSLERFEVSDVSKGSVFVDKGVLLLGNDLHILSRGIIRILHIAILDVSMRFSPQPGVLVCSTLKQVDSVVYLDVLSFDDDYRDYSRCSKRKSVIDIITQGDFSIFTEFTHFAC